MAAPPTTRLPALMGPRTSHHDQQCKSKGDVLECADTCDAESTSDIKSEPGIEMVMSRLDDIAQQLSCILQWQVKVDSSMREVRDELQIGSCVSPIACENVAIPQNLPLLPRLLGKTYSTVSSPTDSERKIQDCIKVLHASPKLEESASVRDAGCEDLPPTINFEQKDEQSNQINSGCASGSTSSQVISGLSSTNTYASAVNGGHGAFSAPPRRSSFENARFSNKRSFFKSLTGGRRARQKRMRSLVAAAEDIEERQRFERHTLKKSNSTISVESLGDLLRNTKTRKARLEGNVDNIAAGFILLNVIVIALSCDYEWPGWFWIDVGFACVFAMELVAKLWINGFRTHFLGKSCKTNIFDATIVAMDVVQIVLAFAYGSPVRESKLLSASLFRFARLARLIRIVRAFQAYFHDLSVMIGGMAGGASTLCWATVMILMPVFVCSVLMKQLVENMEDSSSFNAYFSSVTRSMFTMFRCGFGDCNNDHGQPIFELAWQTDEWQSTLCVLVYCLFMFLITNGLFNVISAIFVDNVVATSVREEKSKRLDRLKDEGLFASRVTVLLRCILRYLKVDVSGKLTDIWSMITKLEVSAEAFAQIIIDPQVVMALKDLDIQEADHAGLFNMLDADKCGRLLFEELVEGLESLRGEPRRSDIVALDLMLRSVQHKVDTILDLSTVSVKNVSLSMQRRSSII